MSASIQLGIIFIHKEGTQIRISIEGSLMNETGEAVTCGNIMESKNISKDKSILMRSSSQFVVFHNLLYGANLISDSVNNIVIEMRVGWVATVELIKQNC